MTVHDPSPGRSRGLLDWLGLSVRSPAAVPPPETPPRERRQVHNARLLEEIAHFLASHQLEVTAHTLGIACSYIHGDDPHLVRLIDRQVHARRPVSMEWLDETFNRANRADELETLARLMDRVETSIEEFGKASHDAHKVTSEYHSALEEHVGDLEQVTMAGAVISELATIAKVMLNRTRNIERQMLRSEAQTRALKRRLDEARRNAEHDHLTGLPNRRAFEARFEHEYREAFAAAEPLCIAFCDVDHFKRVNDDHGHEAGDRVLRLIAESLARISDDRCHVARHGGEEFVMLFRDTPVSEACAKLDRLRDQLAERRLVNRASEQPFGQITFSGGIADAFAFSDRRASLRAADAALYRAKQEGRNRIVIAAPDDGKPPQPD